MSLSAALRWRYATKKFDRDRVLTEPLVEALLDAANLSATSYGLQPFQFVVLRDRDSRESLVASSYGQRQVADASNVVVIATRTDIDEAFIRDYIDLRESGLELPSGALRPYGDLMVRSIGGMTESARMDWAVKQSYIALGTLLAACAALEIDSCPMEGFVPVEYDAKLELSSRNLTATLVVPIGYRATDDETQHQPKIRRPLDAMVVRL